MKMWSSRLTSLLSCCLMAIAMLVTFLILLTIWSAQQKSTHDLARLFKRDVLSRRRDTSSKARLLSSRRSTRRFHLIQPQFSLAGKFAKGLVTSCKDCFDKDGKPIFETNLDVEKFSSDIGFSEGLAAVLIGNYYGFIDKAGKIAIKPHFDFAQQFSEGFAAVGMRIRPKNLGYKQQ